MRFKTWHLNRAVVVKLCNFTPKWCSYAIFVVLLIDSFFLYDVLQTLLDKNIVLERQHAELIRKLTSLNKYSSLR